MRFATEAHPIRLAAGKHTVVVVNYGYKISTQDVNIESGKTTDLACDPGGIWRQGAGPWGRVYITGGRTCVLPFCRTEKLRAILSGTWTNSTKDFWIWKQELLLPPGTHHLTITRGGKDLGPVTLK